MKIISHWKDYYDSARGYGIDPKLVYVRKTRVFDIDYPYNSKNRNNQREYSAAYQITSLLPSSSFTERGWIGFCGRCYPFYWFNGSAYYSYKKLKDAVSNYSELYDDIASINYARERREAHLAELNGELRASCNKWYRYGSLNEHSWERYIQEFKPECGDKSFRFFDSPIFLLWDHLPFEFNKQDGRLVINPRLNQFNFASQVDPVSAFQQISMYIGNNLAKQMDPEVHISDVIKAESHGFDNWSFRRHSSENRKNRKKK
jgi:hypothetical protein